MPRRARLSLPGIPWHIIQRGNNRSACFYAEDDYFFYIYHLAELAIRFGCAIHAYVLMNNHVHLLLTPDRRSSTLWEGRFRSCLTQSEDYVLTCYRYIELNPVRAAMVHHPHEYRWSSYAANAQGKRDKLLVSHEQYLNLGCTDTTRQEAYRALFNAHIDGPALDQIRQATNGNNALGSNRFQREIEVALGRRAKRGEPGRPRSDAS